MCSHKLCISNLKYIASPFQVEYSGPIFFRSELQCSIINYFWWYFHSGPLDGHERKTQAGYRQGEQIAHLPNNLFGNCNIWCFQHNSNRKCGTPTNGSSEDTYMKGLPTEQCIRILRHPGTDNWWKLLHFQGSTGEGKKQRNQKPVKATVTAGNSYCQKHHTKAEREQERNTILLSSQPLVSCWGLLLSKPNGEPVGKGALEIRSEIDSQVQSKAGKDRKWIWDWGGGQRGMIQRITSTSGGSQAFSCTLCLQRCEVVFIRMKPLFNIPPSDAHIKYWCKNDSDLNTYRCFLMC